MQDKRNENRRNNEIENIAIIREDRMKKLLIGLVALNSLFTFANEPVRLVEAKDFELELLSGKDLRNAHIAQMYSYKDNRSAFHPEQHGMYLRQLDRDHDNMINIRLSGTLKKIYPGGHFSQRAFLKSLCKTLGDFELVDSKTKIIHPKVKTNVTTWDYGKQLIVSELICSSSRPYPIVSTKPDSTNGCKVHISANIFNTKGSHFNKFYKSEGYEKIVNHLTSQGFEVVKNKEQANLTFLINSHEFPGLREYYTFSGLVYLNPKKNKFEQVDVSVNGELVETQFDTRANFNYIAGSEYVYARGGSFNLKHYKNVVDQFIAKTKFNTYSCTKF
jgi:hypothetical protein